MKIVFLFVIFSNIYHRTKTANFDFDYCSTQYDETAETGNDFRHACPGFNYNSNPDYNNLRINYLDYPPYIFDDGDSSNPKGIWVDFFKDFTKRACGGSSSTIKWIKRTEHTSTDLQEYCRKNTYKCAMAIPTVGPSGARTLNRDEWNEYWSMSGIALVSIPGELWRNSFTNFGASIIDTWPLFLFCLIAAFISGFILWALETWFNREEFPRPFYNGIYQGFWCCFVSMTTVGYGDKAPKSILGRTFAIFWIVFGIAIIGVLTSLLSSALTDAMYAPPVTFIGNTIGCIGTVQAVKEVIVQNGGTPKVAKDYLELENWMARGLIDGFAMDTRQLQYYYKSRLSKLEPIVTFKLENIYEYTYVYGMAVYSPHAAVNDYRNANPAKSEPWDDCMYHYMDVNMAKKAELEEHYTEPIRILMNATILQPKPTSFSVFDPDSDMFQDLMWTCFAIIIVILVIGIFYEGAQYYLRKTASDTSDTNAMSFNSGYNSGNHTDRDGNLSKEEKLVQEYVEKALKNSEKKIQDTERDVHNEIMEMSRAIRRELNDMKRRQRKDYGL